MLENEHRGVRQVAVEAMISMAQLQSEISLKPAFQACLEKTAQDLVGKLATEGAPLYRWVCFQVMVKGDIY
jgi:hypothetical protein